MSFAMPAGNPPDPAGKNFAVAPGMPPLSGMEVTPEENWFATKRHCPSLLANTVLESEPKLYV